jgi:hypothetical protein
VEIYSANRDTPGARGSRDAPPRYDDAVQMIDLEADDPPLLETSPFDDPTEDDFEYEEGNLWAATTGALKRTTCDDKDVDTNKKKKRTQPPAGEHLTEPAAWPQVSTRELGAPTPRPPRPCDVVGNHEAREGPKRSS